MVEYRIVCTDQLPADQPPKHAHIVGVGTGNGLPPTRRRKLQEVFDAMARGDSFYTLGPRSGRRAGVIKVTCPTCWRYETIRSTPDAVEDNNLDSLPRC